MPWGLALELDVDKAAHNRCFTDVFQIFCKSESIKDHIFGWFRWFSKHSDLKPSLHVFPAILVIPFFVTFSQSQELFLAATFVTICQMTARTNALVLTREHVIIIPSTGHKVYVPREPRFSVFGESSASWKYSTQSESHIISTMGHNFKTRQRFRLKCPQLPSTFDLCKR